MISFKVSFPVAKLEETWCKDKQRLPLTIICFQEDYQLLVVEKVESKRLDQKGWIKRVLSLEKIDTYRYEAYSTRSTSASNSVLNRLSLAEDQENL